MVLILPSSQAQEKVKITSLEWPPFSSKNLEGKGLALKKISKAFENVNTSTSFYFFPWVRAVKGAESGDFDGLTPVYYSQERDEKFLFSDSIMSSSLVLVSRKDFSLKNFSDIKEIYPYKIGLVRGYVNTPAIDHDSNIKSDFATDDLSNIKKLIAGRVQLIVIDLNVLNYLTKTYKIKEKELHVLDPILEDKKLYLLFSKNKKGSSELRNKFNQGLKMLNSSDLNSHP